MDEPDLSAFFVLGVMPENVEHDEEKLWEKPAFVDARKCVGKNMESRILTN